MNIKETMSIINKIKQFRPYFLVNKTNEEILDLAEEWTKVKLQYYDFDDVIHELHKWLDRRENFDKIPDPFMLTKEILKKEDKGKQIIGNVSCSICGKMFPLIYLHKQEDRCRSIRYLKHIYKSYFNKELEVNNDLLEMDDIEFKTKYKEVLIKAYPYIKDEDNKYSEKRLVGKVLGLNE